MDRFGSFQNLLPVGKQILKAAVFKLILSILLIFEAGLVILLLVSILPCSVDTNIMMKFVSIEIWTPTQVESSKIWQIA